MPTEKHYFVEKNSDGKFAVRAKGSERASGLFATQAEAIARAGELNGTDHANVERVKSVSAGPNKWRKA